MLACTDNADVPEKIKAKIETAEQTLQRLLLEARKWEAEKQAPKGRAKGLPTEAKQAIEDCDKICALVDNLVEA